MRSFRYRDEETLSTGTIVGILVGAVAGFAAGMLVAQKTGGIGGMGTRLRSRLHRHRGEEYGMGARGHELPDEDELEDYETDELEEGYDEMLEERVLEAFRNDPTLSERAIDIGSIGEGMIELAGWVETEDEAERAVTVARGVPGVDTVVNRLAVGSEEERFADAARRAREGDPGLTEARWESNIIGTGRRRQGTSRDVDRHADPRVELEERWQNEADAVRNAAGDLEGLAERRRRRQPPKGDRTGGSPIAPSGVPKGDHVANPPQANRQASRAESAEDLGPGEISPGD